MKQKMITIKEEDFEYIETNIPNFSEFVRAAVEDHRAIFDKGYNELNAIKHKIKQLAVSYGAEKELLQTKLEQLEKNQDKMVNIKELPEVIKSLAFLKSGKGNKKAVAEALTNTTGFNITTAHLIEWMKDES